MNEIYGFAWVEMLPIMMEKEMESPYEQLWGHQILVGLEAEASTQSCSLTKTLFVYACDFHLFFKVLKIFVLIS